ncbi:hypothetical protein RRG08_038962 [Elysia crispata]|uniref:Glucose-methanol-choline oxidoreductase N-terminal domain-containing protein n=1 Tax=Elysia crispata TaxID=231223 RepID=A0AAE0Y7T1_9GAST|nr:hypothetical protein RRG08_038962 [Elysia crispata]
MCGTALALVTLIAALAVALVYPTLFQSEPPLASTVNNTYDFIIVGGGAAGSVLAARLSEDQNVSVLLLEAGPSDWGNQLIDIPAMAMATYSSDIDWAYSTEQEDGLFKGLVDERLYWIGGKVLGGSGSINALLVRMENMRVAGLEDSAYHGKNGPLAIDHMKPSLLADKLVEAGRDLGFSINEDYNGKSMEGIFHSQNNRLKNCRLSPSRAYLHPAMSRTNLDVFVNAHVQKIIIKNKRAVGVEVIKNGRKLVVNCETWACLDEYRANILAGIYERHTLISFSTALSFSLFLDFTAVRLENGSYVKIALLASMGNSLAAANQKMFQGRSAKLSLRPRSCLSSVSSSCSFKVLSFRTADVELNESLTQ